MKKKIRISNEFVIPNEFLAISSQLNDYQLAWEINQNLKIDLSISETDFISSVKAKDDIDIVLYSYNSERGYYYLLKNNAGGMSIIPKLKNIDYLLIVEDTKIELNDFSKILSLLKSVLGTFKIKLDKQQSEYLKKILMK